MRSLCVMPAWYLAHRCWRPGGIPLHTRVGNPAIRPTCCECTSAGRLRARDAIPVRVDQKRPIATSVASAAKAAARSRSRRSATSGSADRSRAAGILEPRTLSPDAKHAPLSTESAQFRSSLALASTTPRIAPPTRLRFSRGPHRAISNPAATRDTHAASRAR